MLCGFLRPEFGVTSGLHLASTTGACVVIPEVYAVGTATEAESAYKGVEAGGGISYDAAYDKGTMLWQSGQVMASMCWPMKPRPSYMSVA